jgi:hypothetical protein
MNWEPRPIDDKLHRENEQFLPEMCLGARVSGFDSERTRLHKHGGQAAPSISGALRRKPAVPIVRSTGEHGSSRNARGAILSAGIVACGPSAASGSPRDVDFNLRGT